MIEDIIQWREGIEARKDRCCVMQEEVIDTISKISILPDSKDNQKSIEINKKYFSFLQEEIEKCETRIGILKHFESTF